MLHLVLLLGLASAPADGEILLAPGTKYETPAFVITADRKGPTVVVIGGMHGNEVSGWRAARAIRHWPIRRGRLVVIPRANTLGLDRFQRNVPTEKGSYDLNRQFPSKAGAKISGPLASDIWSLLENLKPDWVLDLHESVDYRSKSTKKRKYLGNSLIRSDGAATAAKAKEMAEDANALTPRKDRKWVVLRSPIEGSVVRAAATRLGAEGVIAETCRKDHLAIRVRQHRIVVHRLLTSFFNDTATTEIYTVLPARRKPGEIRVAFFNTYGTGWSSAFKVERCLTTDARFVCRRITATEIMAGALEPFDVVVFPGGTGSGSAKTLTAKGREKVRQFVADGGGYFGVCAGAYLATTCYSWSIGILDAKVVDSAHWARGRGTVRLTTTKTGRRLFEEKRESVLVRYGQGPLLAPGGRKDLDDYETLAVYATEIAKNGAPKGVMKGTPAIVRARFGKGRVIAVSPHPEDSRDVALRGWVRRSVAWLGER
jgi:glutamine amidotransferase-like uncharacterized protein